MKKPQNVIESGQYIEPYTFEKNSEAILYYSYIEQIEYIEHLESKLKSLGVSKRFAVATETTDDIIEGRKYEIVESESMGHYIIDESGKETYCHHTSLKVC